MARALIVALALLAGACGRAPEAPVRLQAFGDPVEIAGYRELIGAYEAANPGAKVELIPVGKQRDHMAKLATAFAAGDPPELFLLNFRRFGQFADKGVLAPLGPALAQAGQWRAEDFYEPAVEAFRFGGEQLCLPQNVSSLAVYYNRALFRAAGIEYPQAGWTLAEFAVAALNLRGRAKDAGGRRVWGLGFEPALIRIVPFLWALGGDIVDDVHAPRRVTLDNRALLGLQFVKNLRASAVVPPLAAVKAEDLEARFARGGLGMLLQSRRYTATLRAVPGLDWDVAPFPRGHASLAVLHADAYCQAAAARNPAAARRFVAYALSDAGQALLAKSGRVVPARRSVAESPAFLDPAQPPASARVFLDAIPRMRRTPNVAVWHEFESTADVLLEEWFYEAPAAGEAEGSADVLRVAAQLRAALQPILDRQARP